MSQRAVVPRAPCRILVVDDDAAVREAVQKVLREAGYKSWTAADGAQGLEQLQVLKIDLLLLDLGLPVHHGWALFRRIKREHPALPVIVMTGQANQQNAGFEAGALLLIEKPLDAQRLLAAIREFSAALSEAGLRHQCVACESLGVDRSQPNASPETPPIEAWRTKHRRPSPRNQASSELVAGSATDPMDQRERTQT